MCKHKYTCTSIMCKHKYTCTSIMCKHKYTCTSIMCKHKYTCTSIMCKHKYICTSIMCSIMNKTVFIHRTHNLPPPPHWPRGIKRGITFFWTCPRTHNILIHSCTFHPSMCVILVLKDGYLSVLYGISHIDDPLPSR